MSIVPVIKQMITLSLLMLTGFFANRFGILGKDAQKWMSKLIINITCPALILSSVTTSQRLESNRMASGSGMDVLSNASSNCPGCSLRAVKPSGRAGVSPV